MENDIQYFKAVIDTANLISIWLKKGSGDIKKILSSLEINLESKYGPFTTELSNQIGVNETLGLKSPDSYWKGVQDTLSLLKNFINWKQISGSNRTVDNFLLEIINKSNIRIEPLESPLITALGILFDHEFSENTNNRVETPLNTQEQFSIPKNPITVSNQPTIKSEVSNNSYNPPNDQMSKEPEYDKSFDPNEFIDDEKFLDQFIADSIRPPDINDHATDNIKSSERDYLRSALEELSINQEDSEEDKEITIQFKGTNDKKENVNNENSNKPKIIEDNTEEKDTSRLLSSSLRDALRMLREED